VTQEQIRLQEARKGTSHGRTEGCRLPCAGANPKPTQNNSSRLLFYALFHALVRTTTPANSLKFRFSHNS
jgi:hypothetical protein